MMCDIELNEEVLQELEVVHDRAISSDETYNTRIGPSDAELLSLCRDYLPSLLSELRAARAREALLRALVTTLRRNPEPPHAGAVLRTPETE